MTKFGDARVVDTVQEIKENVTKYKFHFQRRNRPMMRRE
jgi:hypothetical protein